MNEHRHYSPSICVTHRCNLNCVYCYQQHDQSKMSFETGKEVMKKIFASVPEECDDIHIGFIGGEPMLEFELIRDICEYTWQRQASKPYIFFATTNGTILTEEMKQWLISNIQRFKLQLSLDGNRETQNFNRSNSFDKIDIPFFQKYYLDQGVKMTVSEYSIQHFAENVKFIHSLGFDVHGSNLAEGNFEWDNDNNLKILAEQLTELVDFYVAHPEIKPCQLLDKTLAFCEQKITVRKKYCGIGYGANFFDYDGTEYPCPYCTPMTFTRQELDSIQKTDFANDDNFIDEDCYENCYLYPVCSSCAGNNYLQTGKFNKHERSKCRVNKLTALFIAELQAQKIIRKQDDMDENMRYWTIEAIKQIRNSYLEEMIFFLR